MVQSSVIEVIKDVQDNSLITLYEARLALNLFSTATDFEDDQLEMLVRWSSDEIAVACNRVFAKQTVTEVFHDLKISNRLYLNYWPIAEVQSVTENAASVYEDQNFEVSSDGGYLLKLSGTWVEPVTVTYTGGYDLPFEAPDALKQAVSILTREAYYAAIRGDASIRQIAHKESRISFFDPRTMAGGAKGGTTSSAALKRIDDLIKAFTRYEV